MARQALDELARLAQADPALARPRRGPAAHAERARAVRRRGPGPGARRRSRAPGPARAARAGAVHLRAQRGRLPAPGAARPVPRRRRPPRDQRGHRAAPAPSRGHARDRAAVLLRGGLAPDGPARAELAHRRRRRRPDRALVLRRRRRASCSRPSWSTQRGAAGSARPAGSRRGADGARGAPRRGCRRGDADARGGADRAAARPRGAARPRRARDVVGLGARGLAALPGALVRRAPARPEGARARPGAARARQFVHAALERVYAGCPTAGSAREELPAARARLHEALAELEGKHRISVDPDRLRAEVRRVEADLIRHLEYAAHSGSVYAARELELRLRRGRRGQPAAGRARRRRAAAARAGSTASTSAPRARSSATTRVAAPSTAPSAGFEGQAARWASTCARSSSCSSSTSSAACTSRSAATSCARAASCSRAPTRASRSRARPDVPEQVEELLAEIEAAALEAVREIRAGRLGHAPRPAAGRGDGCSYPSICRAVRGRERGVHARAGAAIARREERLIVTANAGSGKTRVLTERFVRSCSTTDRARRDPRDHVHGEGRGRAARARARAVRRARRRDLAQATEAAWISTIHGFCMRGAAGERASPPAWTRPSRSSTRVRPARCATDAFERALAGWLGNGARRADALDVAAAYGVDNCASSSASVHDACAARAGRAEAAARAARAGRWTCCAPAWRPRSRRRWRRSESPPTRHERGAIDALRPPVATPSAAGRWSMLQRRPRRGRPQGPGVRGLSGRMARYLQESSMPMPCPSGAARGAAGALRARTRRPSAPARVSTSTASSCSPAICSPAMTRSARATRALRADHGGRVPGHESAPARAPELLGTERTSTSATPSSRSTASATHRSSCSRGSVTSLTPPGQAEQLADDEQYEELNEAAAT